MNIKPAKSSSNFQQLVNGKEWKALDVFSEISLKFSALLLLVIILAIWYQVFARFFYISTKGIEEMGSYLLIWVCYLGVAFGLKKGRHIRVDIIYGRMPKNIQRIFLIIGNLICILYSIIITWEGIKMIGVFHKLGELSLILRIPLYIVNIAVPVGMVLFALEALREIVLTLKERKIEVPVSLKGVVEGEVAEVSGGNLTMSNK